MPSGAPVIEDIKIGLGGVAATPLRATATEELLNGDQITDDLLSRAAQTMSEEGTPMSDHRASSAYRSAMLRSSLLKFFAESPQLAPAYQEA